MRSFTYHVADPTIYEIVNFPHLTTECNLRFRNDYSQVSGVLDPRQRLVDYAALTIVHTKFSRFNDQMSEDNPYEEVDPMMYIGCRQKADSDLLGKALANELSDHKLVAICCDEHGLELEYWPLHDDSGLERFYLECSNDLITEIRVKDASGNIFDLCHWSSHWRNVKDYFHKGGQYHQAGLHTVILESDESGQVQRRIAYDVSMEGGLGFWSQLWARCAGRKRSCSCVVAEYKS